MKVRIGMGGGGIRMKSEKEKGVDGTPRFSPTLLARFF
jgi:hypothetical protein